MFEQNGVQTGFADINGGRLYYEVAGDGPVLVLAHAGIADRRMWDDQFLFFAQHFRVIRFDFWGFGKSSIAKNSFFLHRDLYQLLEFLGVEQAHLMGCSLGGRVIIDLALEYPKMVNSLIVVGSGLSGYQFAGEVLRRFVEQVLAARARDDYDREIELRLQLWVVGRSRTPDQVDPRVRERAREMFLGRPGTQGEGKQLEPAAIGRLNEIEAPTLIIVGDRDEANIATIADLLAANVRGAQKIIVPDTAHLPHMEKPEHFNHIVLEFLRMIKPSHNHNQPNSNHQSKIVGWEMTPAETQTFFTSLGKKVVTFVGYSVDYENEGAMLGLAKKFLSGYSPETFLINIGGTSGGIGAVYPIAKEMGFKTTGIVSSLAAEYLENVSEAVDHVCFVADNAWGGNSPDSGELSPTSQAMVLCSDILIGIGGGEVSRDELIAAKEQGKPVFFYPAEMSHEGAIRRARDKNMPAPESFWGAAHEIFGNQR